MHRHVVSCAVLASIAGLAVLALCTDQAGAALISYATPDSTYTQDFDSLAASSQGQSYTWTDGATLTGWYAVTNSTVQTVYKVNNGTSADVTGLHSNGTIGDSDRALGTQSNTTSNERIGVAFSNDTGTTLATITITYDGEEWRRINNEGYDDYVVEYQIFDAGLGDLLAGSGWTAVPGLTFVAPNVGVGGGTVSLDGNAAENRVAGLTDTIIDLTWNPDQELWIRFTDSGSAQHQLAVDNFEFTAQAVPEPSTLAMLSGLVCLGLLARRKRKA